MSCLRPISGLIATRSGGACAASRQTIGASAARHAGKICGTCCGRPTKICGTLPVSDGKDLRDLSGSFRNRIRDRGAQRCGQTRSPPGSSSRGPAPDRSDTDGPEAPRRGRGRMVPFEIDDDRHPLLEGVGRRDRGSASVGGGPPAMRAASLGPVSRPHHAVMAGGQGGAAARAAVRRRGVGRGQVARAAPSALAAPARRGVNGSAAVLTLM
jgi:hypothetical protein